MRDQTLNILVQKRLVPYGIQHPMPEERVHFDAIDPKEHQEVAGGCRADPLGFPEMGNDHAWPMLFHVVDDQRGRTQVDVWSAESIRHFDDSLRLPPAAFHTWYSHSGQLRVFENRTDF